MTTDQAGAGHDHAFGSGPEYTVGVEEELMLLDPADLSLLPHGPQVVARAHDEIHVKPEVRQCMVELASRPWSRSRDLLKDLAALRGSLLDGAQADGCLVVAAGVHPFATPEIQPTTTDPRYLAIMAEVSYPWLRALVFGTHVHVAVATPDKAIQVTEALLPDLPVLIALAATSPYWRGRRTGLASNRLAALAGVPRTGLPPAFARFEDYTRALDVLARAGAVADASQVWWDVRSQSRLGTIEVRVLDAQPRVRDAAALAGLVQALVRHHGLRWDAGVRESADRFLTAENRWLAVRHGMAARLVRPDGSTRSVAGAFAELIERIRPDASHVGAGWALDHLEQVVAQGTAGEHLAAWGARDGLTGVVRRLVAETRADAGSG